MNVIVFGLPASGKGTFAKELVSRFGLTQISTGDMIREVSRNGKGPSADALRAQPVGTFAPDDLILQMIKERLAKPDCAAGVIFDGFPRTSAQAQALMDSGIRIDAVVEIECPEEVCFERSSMRWVHDASGRTYHLKNSPPKEAGIDDVTGEALIQRKDDTPETMRRRCDDFTLKTKPAIALLREASAAGAFPFVKVDGSLSASEANAQGVLGLLEPRAKKPSL